MEISHFGKNYLKCLVCQQWRAIAKIVWATTRKIIAKTRKKLIRLENFNLLILHVFSVFITFESLAKKTISMQY